MLIISLCLLLGCCFLSNPAFARKRRSLPRWEWHLTTSLAALYNDNLLRLSELDRNSFLRDPGVFSIPMETTDDLESEISLSPSVNWRAPWTLMISGDYHLKATNRAQNSFTDYQTHTFGLSVRPRVRGYRWSARFRVFTIPSFYLRVYRDRDHNEYHAARFSNWDYEGSFRYRVLDPLWLGARFAWGSYYYNAKFTEYDSEYWDVSGMFSYSFPRNIGIAGGYTRRLSDNVGRVQSVPATLIAIGDEPIEDTEYGNSDFTEDEINASVSAMIPWIKFRRTSAEVAYRLRRRVYTTDSPLEHDPFHRGRLDNRGQVTTSVRMNVTSKLDLSSYFTYEVRRTDSEWTSVPSVKDFIRREIGLVFSYSIR